MRSGWRLVRIGGIDVRIDPSWAFIAVLLTYNLWLTFSDRGRFPGTSGGASFGIAVVTAALFFASVLGHELAHAGMSRLRDIPVEGITLFLFGGATEARLESRGPLDEFLVAVVGPVTSLAIGGLFLLAHGLTQGSVTGPLHAMLGYLGVVNVSLGAFNLLPGFPLDGGRVLRSVLWRATGNLGRATRIAARIGQLMGVALIGFGVFVAMRRGEILALWPALIGWFLYRVASDALKDRTDIRRLASVTAGQVMSAPPPTVPADLSVEAAVQRYLIGHEREAFPVVDDGRVVGFVSLSTIKGVGLERPVRDAMVSTRGTVEAGPAEPLNEVADRMGGASSRTALVIDGGRLVGVIEPEDIDRYLRRASRGGRPDGQDPSGPDARPPEPPGGGWPQPPGGWGPGGWAGPSTGSGGAGPSSSGPGRPGSGPGPGPSAGPGPSTGAGPSR